MNNFDYFVELVKHGDYLILDTETTGFDRPAEVCQIGIIDPLGNVVMNQLIRPRLSIPQAASAVHGITLEMVKDAPIWLDVRAKMLKIIEHQALVVYNAIYDRKMMHSSDDNYKLPRFEYKANSNWYCAMEWYAEYYGQIHPVYGSYMWQKLRNAVAQQGIAIAGEHDAIGDCQMTRLLIQHCVEKLSPNVIGSD